MSVVYSLRERLKADPQQVADVRALTLGDKPDFPGGLKGTYGLFDSEEWWRNIATGVAPVTRLKGTITSVHFEGMNNDSSGFEMTMADGSIYRYSCAANHKKDRERYVVGKSAEVVYVTEPLRNPIPVSDGSFETHSDIVLEISIEN